MTADETATSETAADRAAAVLAEHRLHDKRSDPRYPWCVCGWEPSSAGVGVGRVYEANLLHIAQALDAANLLATTAPGEGTLTEDEAAVWDELWETDAANCCSCPSCNYYQPDYEAHKDEPCLLRTLIERILAARSGAADPLRQAEWQDTLRNDGTYEYTTTGDCHGTWERHLRRRPALRPSPWEKCDSIPEAADYPASETQP